MPTTIITKNGTGAPDAADLEQGELAVDLTNKRLYTEDAGGSVIEVGSNPSALSIAGTAVTATATELNVLDGITSTTAELNILDGVTSTASELNLVDGSVAGTIVNSKAVVYGSSGEVNATTLQIGGNAITSTAAELNILDGATLDVNELNILDGVTASTAELNILDGVTADATELNILDGVTATTAELNYLDIATLGTSAASKALTADANNDTIVTGSVRGTITTDNDLSFDMNVTNNFKCTPTGTGTLTFTNITAGQSGNIWLDNSGGHVISAAATTYISSADLTTISTAGVYFLSYYADGTNVLVASSPALTSTGA